MQIHADKDVLQAFVSVVQRAVSTRSTLPILSNIRIDADGEVLLTATDLELVITAKVPGEVESAGCTTLPAKLLSEILSSQADGMMTLETDDQDHSTFTSGKSRMQVNGLPADEFPVVPEIGECTTVALAQPLLKRMIAQCLVAASKDETRARLTGVYLEVVDGEVRMVATDTHRLATRLAHEADGGNIGVIIPARTLKEVSRILGDDGVVTLEVSDSMARFTFDNGVTVISRLIEGEFPNYRKVIPSEEKMLFTAPTEALRQAVKRCSIVAEDNQKVKLTVNSEGLLKLSSATRTGSSDEEIDVQSELGGEESVEICFNAEYLLDALEQIQDDQVRIVINASNEPGTVRPGGEEEYVYVIMPMSQY